MHLPLLLTTTNFVEIVSLLFSIATCVTCEKYATQFPDEVVIMNLQVF